MKIKPRQKSSFILYSGNYVISNINFNDKILSLKYITSLYYLSFDEEKRKDILFFGSKEARIMQKHLNNYFTDFSLEIIGESLKWTDEIKKRQRETISNSFYLYKVRSSI